MKSIRDSLVARITVCRMVDRGSIPRLGGFFFFFGFTLEPSSMPSKGRA
ncbi:uncharacterized protein PRCAT00000405001 [Priceomyces carsonii]|nr:unnamed protein product [Priceomyces carsonii]